MKEFLYLIGMTNANSLPYLFWSGIGSNLSYLGIIVIIYRHLKCKECWRLAHHRVEGTHYKTCHKHATLDTHATIKSEHSKKYPEQHKLINKEKK